MLSSSIEPRSDDPGLEEERVRELVVARRAVEEDEVLLRQLGELRLAANGERMRRVDDEHERVLVERELLDVRVVEARG